MTSSDTIAAIATAPANGAIGVIRLSGPSAMNIFLNIFRDKEGTLLTYIKPRLVSYGSIVARDGRLLDQVLAFYMSAPHTFTGEDVVEISCHGNLYLMRQILREIVSFNDVFAVRLAAAGEFSRRAFLNGKMDLTQAEAIHELITAESEAAVKLSLSNLDRRLKFIVDSLRAKLRQALALVEASFEFTEEDIQTYDRSELVQLVVQTRAELINLQSAYHTSKLYDSGVSVAIVGRPNVGKSSLLNALLKEERAIVTDIPGTTRDVVEGVRIVNGVRFLLRDTAGLRESGDKVENMGIARAKELVEKSDIIFYIVDNLSDLNTEGVTLLRDRKNCFFIFNKFDNYLENYSNLSHEQLNVHAGSFKYQHAVSAVISATSSFGLDDVEQLLVSFLNSQKSVQNNVHINERQYEKLSLSIACTDVIYKYLHGVIVSEEIVAEDLKTIINHLSEITGDITNDMVLGEIFSRFCIGK